MGFNIKRRNVAPTWHDAPVLCLYTDGSAWPTRNTERRGGWGWCLCEPGDESAPLEGASGRCPGPVTTNNRSELRAAAYGIQHVTALAERGEWTGRELMVLTDSQYVIGLAVGNYRPKANADLVRMLRSSIAVLEAAGVRVCFCHVKAHAGHPGNEHADQLAGLWRGGGDATAG